MADLDDFFAKKDKKKGKAKKFTSSELAKKLEDNSKKVESLKKEQRTATSQPAEIGEEIVIVEQVSGLLKVVTSQILTCYL